MGLWYRIAIALYSLDITMINMEWVPFRNEGLSSVEFMLWFLKRSIPTKSFRLGGPRDQLAMAEATTAVKKYHATTVREAVNTVLLRLLVLSLQIFTLLADLQPTLHSFKPTNHQSLVSDKQDGFQTCFYCYSLSRLLRVICHGLPIL